MTTTDVERAAHAATVALADFDRAGVTQVLQTLPALTQTLRELLAAVTLSTPPADDVREAFVNGWYSARQNPDIAAATHSPDFPGEVRPRGPVTDAEKALTGAWTDERIREAFINDGGQADYYDPINGAREQRRIAGAIFDRWLAERDEARSRRPVTFAEVDAAAEVYGGYITFDKVRAMLEAAREVQP